MPFVHPDPEVPADAEFLAREGDLLCRRCGTGNDPTHKFCKECGQRLAFPAGVSATFQSPESYTPKYLAEKIRTVAALENERKQVTVLFADIKNSTEIVAERDAEEAVKIIDAVLNRMIEAVHRFEGTVGRVMGDGLMALFGAPVALENHAVRGCYAALRMQDTVKRYSEEIRRTHGISVDVRIGVNSGAVIVRSIRSNLQVDYTAVGQTTYLAARMEQIATPGSILVTSNVVGLTKGYIDVKPLGPVPIKGLRTPVDVFEVSGTGSAQARLQVAAARGLTQFANRVAEKEVLREAFEQANIGHGQIVVALGEAGIGKSRLLYEFIHSRQAHGWLVLESSAVSYRRAAPYAAVIDSLKNYFKIDARDSVQTIREKVTSKLLALDQSPQDAIPTALYLLEALPEEHGFHGFEPSQRRECIVQTMKHIVFTESRLQPVVIVFEDLQWTDLPSLAVLGALVDGLSDNRVLLLASYRPGYQDDWASRRHYRQLRLDALHRASLEQLLHSLLGADPSLDALKELFIERTGGNPFFVEEMVRMLVETGVLIGENGRHSLAKPVSHVDVPPMVQDVIASRIDRLPPMEKRLLHEASVIGKDVSFTLLQMVADMPEVELRGHLVNLQSAEFLYETRLFPDLEYTFKHALTHQVAYAGLLRDRRREIHARILECMEKLHADRLTEQVEHLSHHALQGEIWSKALTYLREAGVKAVDRHANREAVVRFEQALDVIQHLPEDHDVLRQAIDIRFDIRNALQPLGDLGQIIERLQEAEQLAARIGDQRRLGWVASYLTEHFRMLGDPDSAARAGERALTIARQRDDLPLLVVTNLPLGLLYHAMGEYRRAIEFFTWNMDQLKGELLHKRFGLFGLPSIHSRSFLAWCFAEVGDFAEGEVIAEEAVQLARAADHPFSMMYAYLGMGVLHLRRGDFQRAVSTLGRALEVGESVEIPVGFSYGASYLGYALALVGRAEEGIRLLEQSIGPDISERFVARHSLRIVYLGEAYLLSGRLDDASNTAGQALVLAQKHQERGHEAYALRLLGDIAAHLGNHAEAEAHYCTALQLAEQLEMRPLAAHCHWSLAGLFRGASDQEREYMHAATARTEFHSMGMVGWLQRMEASLAQPPRKSL